MFVQIGNVAFNPDHLTKVLFIPSQEEAELSLLGGRLVLVGGQRYSAFLDWWKNKADVYYLPVEEE